MTAYERSWMRAHKETIVRWCASIRLRYFAQNEFKRMVCSDARLTRKERIRLQHIVSHWTKIKTVDRNWFQWYVYTMLPRRRKHRRDLARLRTLMSMPHSRLVTSIPSGKLVLHVRYDPTPQIVCWLEMKHSDRTLRRHLVGCLDEENVLSATMLWDARVERWMALLCADPLAAMGRFAAVCPVCGEDVQLASSWSFECSLQYVSWSAKVAATNQPIQCGVCTKRPHGRLQFCDV